MNLSKFNINKAFKFINLYLIKYLINKSIQIKNLSNISFNYYILLKKKNLNLKEKLQFEYEYDKIYNFIIKDFTNLIPYKKQIEIKNNIREFILNPLFLNEEIIKIENI